jgi:hypothetical protein
VPTRANTQPAFGCYLPDAHAAIARPHGLTVLTLEGNAIAAITCFADTGVFDTPGGLERCRTPERLPTPRRCRRRGKPMPQNAALRAARRLPATSGSGGTSRRDPAPGKSGSLLLSREAVAHKPKRGR